MDQIVFTEEIADAWQDFSARIASFLNQLRLRGRQIPKIPDAYARQNPDGSLTITQPVPGIIEFSMNVPAGLWGYKH